MKIPEPLLTQYLANPIQMDETVRTVMGLPDNRYYTVSVYPIAGIVTIDKRSREVKAKKISKSDQK